MFPLVDCTVFSDNDKKTLDRKVRKLEQIVRKWPLIKQFPADFKLSLSSLFVVISCCFYLFIRFQSFSRCLNFTVIFLTVTSEDVCCYI